MTLGIALSWRARYHRIGVSGISWIPKGPRRWSRAPRARLALSHRCMHAPSDAARKQNTVDADCSNGEPEAEVTDERTTAGNVAADLTAPSSEWTSQGGQTMAASRALETPTQQAAQPLLLRKSSTPNIQPLHSSPQSTLPIRKGLTLPEQRQRHREANSKVDASTEKFSDCKPQKLEGDRPILQYKTSTAHVQSSSTSIEPTLPTQNATLIPEGRRQQRETSIRMSTVIKDFGGRIYPVKDEKRELERVTSDSVVVPSPVGYHARRETLGSYTRSHKILTAQKRLEALQLMKNRPIKTWRDILDLLRLNTRRIQGPWQAHGRKILISKNLVNVLLHAVDHTIWDIHERSRCHIELHCPQQQSSAQTSDSGYLLLSGNEEALEYATEEIRRLAAGICGHIDIEGGNGSEVPEVAPFTNPMSEEKVWFSSQNFQRPSYVWPYTLCRPYKDIPRPMEWTPQSLEAYVAAITKATLPTHLAYEFYLSGSAADRDALDMLHSAFESATGYQSSRAFKLALHFTESHGFSYREDSRMLLNTMQKSGVRIDTSVFNILLFGSAKVKDLQSFYATMSMMTQRGCKPNIDTWIAFMQMIENEQVLWHILQHMHSLGLFIEPNAAQIVAREFVVYDIRRNGDNWPGMKEFLRGMDTKYGKNWESRSAMNKIMAEVGRMGQFTSCRDLFDIMAESSTYMPTTLTLNTILTHARAYRNLSMILAILERAHDINVQLDTQSYHELFGFAFRVRKPNMMGVIWRLACIENKTSWDMRDRVSKLMSVGEQMPPDAAAAAAADALPALPSFHQPDMVKHLESVPHHRRGPLVGSLLSKRYNGWRPVEPLHKLLARAVEADVLIHDAVKLAKQQEAAGASNASWPIRRVTVPGISFVLERPLGVNSSAMGGNRVKLNMTVEHLAPS